MENLEQNKKEKEVETSSEKENSKIDKKSSKNSEGTDNEPHNIKQLGSEQNEKGSSIEYKKVTEEHIFKSGEIEKPLTKKLDFLKPQINNPGKSSSTVDDIDLDEIKRIQDKYDSENIKDEVMFKSRCKLFRKNHETKKFEDRGEGEIYINKCQSSGLCKISMVRDQIKTLGCNHFIDPDFDCVAITSYKRAWSWFTSSDSCYTGKNDSKNQFYVVRFKTDQDSDNFKKFYDSGKNINSEKASQKK